MAMFSQVLGYPAEPDAASEKAAEGKDKKKAEPAPPAKGGKVSTLHSMK